MTSSRGHLTVSRTAVVVGLAFLAGGIVLALLPPRDVPNLHAILDTSSMLCCGLLACLLWDVGTRLENGLARWLATAFGVAACCELVHVLVTVEWVGLLAPVTAVADVLRPGTWLLAAYILPAGIALTAWRGVRREASLAAFAAGLMAVLVVLVAFAFRSPAYTAPWWLGTTRPALLGVPAMCLLAAGACWSRRTDDRLLPNVAATAALLAASHVFILYSQAPHDTTSMATHAAKIGAYVALIVAVWQMASWDMRELARTERSLAELNHELEARVRARTAELEAANQSLRMEADAHARTERVLDESRILLQSMTDNSPSVIYAKDLEGRYLFVNPRFVELFGGTIAETIGKTDFDVAPREAAEGYREMDRRVIASNVALAEEESVTLDGIVHTYLSVKAPLRDSSGAPCGVFGVSTDISDRHRAQAALRASEARTRSMIDAALDAVVTMDAGGFITGWTAQAEKVFGWPVADVLGRPLAEVIIPESLRAAHTEGLARYLATGATRVLNRRLELHAVRRDGTEFPVEISIARIHFGDAPAFSAFVRDISERHEAGQRLEAQLARVSLLARITRAIGERQDLASILQVVVRSLEDHLPLDFCCVCLYDQVQQALVVTRVGARSQALAFELAMPEAATIPIDENGLARAVSGHLVCEDGLDRSSHPFPRRLARGGLRSFVAAPLVVETRMFGVLIAARRQSPGFNSADCEFLRQLSEHVALAAHHSELYGALQEAYDDLRQTQQAILQQERLKALGQMASGIAHDINNAISPIVLYTEAMLESEEQLSAQGRDYLAIVQRAADDVAQTVARMREFYRQREPQLLLLPVELNALVQQVITLTRARWSDMPQQRGVVIETVLQLEPGLPFILGIESELREALINLVFNAVDAMPDGGTLTVRTRTGATAGAPGQVLIEIVDTGVGMSAETRRLCLEPFFTTKGERGTGLGLAMVYGALQRHAATVEIDSSPGAGTTMRLAFVLPPPVGATAADKSGTPVARRPGRLRILLVDDDPLLLKSLRDTLEADGHVVTIAHGGQAGIDAFREAHAHDREFAVVITDLGMPYVDGRQVATAIKATVPATPVVMLTGWGLRLVDDGDVPPHVDRVIGKPPQLATLRQVLGELTGDLSQP